MPSQCFISSVTFLKMLKGKENETYKHFSWYLSNIIYGETIANNIQNLLTRAVTYLCIKNS